MKKNFKKRVSAMLMAGVLGLSMFASGCKVDPAKIYEEAQKKQAELNGVDMSMEIAMNMEAGGQSLTIGADMDTKTTGIKDPENMKMSMNGGYSINMGEGQNMDIDMDMWYGDGYYYMEMLGQKMKYPMDLDEITEQVESTTKLTDLSEEMLANMEMTQEGKKFKFTFDVEAAELDEMLDEIMAMGRLDQMLEQLGGSFDITECKGDLTISEKGYIESQNFKIKCVMKAEDEEVGMDMEVKVTINNPGEEVSVELPDADDYTEVDPSTMGLN